MEGSWVPHNTVCPLLSLLSLSLLIATTRPIFFSFLPIFCVRPHFQWGARRISDDTMATIVHGLVLSSPPHSNL